MYEKLTMVQTTFNEKDSPIASAKLKLERLTYLKDALTDASTTHEKLEILDALPEVDAFFSSPSAIRSFLAGLSPDCEVVIKAICAIGQGPRLFELPKGDPTPKLRTLLEELLSIESFYADIGGIVGYQQMVLTLLLEGEDPQAGKSLLPPKPIDLTKVTREVNEAILTAIRMQGQMAELYPVGGAADRLQLKDENTDEALPAARLLFLGKPLLEGVIGDLQAREYLHYKLFNKQVTTPIAMMTSHLNRNDEHIRSICEKNSWFGRGKESFHFVTQPTVPLFNRRGDWCLEEPLKLLLKPGGHGMLWKLLEQGGLFKWFKEKGCKKALIRQINNPMAATDYGLLAFLGYGHLGDCSFGFASCPRLVNAHEGMNVIRVSGRERALTNVEYCDFAKFGIQDRPHQAGSRYSHFPSNTNILFADLKEVDEAVKKHPFPGLLMNFRTGSHHHSKGGEEEIARLETTMQNIADVIDADDSYLTFYERRKTISTTKRKSSGQGALLETPEGCYYDHILNATELLKEHCNLSLPELPSEEEFIAKGPPFLFSFHPALGPLYSIIGEKIQGGSLHEGAELQLEIADLELKNLELEGSLLIHAQSVMGHIDEEGELHYSDRTGQCSLKNVRVENAGIDWEEDHLYWKHEIKRCAALKIILHGHSQFVARDLTIRGDLTLEVDDGMRMIAKEEKGTLEFTLEPIEDEGPLWRYSIGDACSIEIKKIGM
ncbi:MAG: putative uridylyltransferase [Chlamydiae bacterium]|nr:putative uridylyltransferase [Chlamydiota bacterium]